MNKLTLADVAFPAVYESQRAAFRQEIIALKQRRRVRLGENVALVFENRETMRFQIQEMCRVEGIKDQDGIQAEVDVYNSLIPGPNELSASLFIEVTDSQQIKPALDSFLCLDSGGCVRLEFAATAVAATFEEGHSEADRISAVHYVRFHLTADQQRAFADASEVVIVLDHPNHAHRTVLSAETVAELRADLTDTSS